MAPGAPVLQSNKPQQQQQQSPMMPMNNQQSQQGQSSSNQSVMQASNSSSGMTNSGNSGGGMMTHPPMSRGLMNPNPNSPMFQQQQQQMQRTMQNSPIHSGHTTPSPIRSPYNSATTPSPQHPGFAGPGGMQAAQQAGMMGNFNR